jgi:hypothetical protein
LRVSERLSLILVTEDSRSRQTTLHLAAIANIPSGEPYIREVKYGPPPAINADPPVLVLHDQDTGAMRRLPSFLDQVQRLGIEFVQSFPDSCVPIRRGQATGGLEHLYLSDRTER